MVGLIITQPILKTNRPSEAAVSPDRLREHVVALSEEFHPRSFAHPANLARTANYIRSMFSETRAEVSGQFYEAKGRRYENIIAFFPGTKPDRIIVGTHYDSCGDTPGADDNASGVAGLIELAGLISGVELNHTVELVAYCTEEPPFFATEHMGSAHHASKLRRENTPVRAMLALEMIGYFSDEPWSQRYPALLFRFFYPSRGDFIAVVGNTRQRRLIAEVKRGMRGATGLRVVSASVPASIPGVDYSDHRNYWLNGYPAVMITDTAFLRNFEYHQAGDTADRLDYGRMAEVVASVYEAVRKLDE